MKPKRYVGYMSKNGFMGWEKIKDFGEILFIGVSKKKRFWVGESVKVEVIVKEIKKTS